MVAISVDTIEESTRLAEKLGLEFQILSDVREEATRTWGLVHENAKPGGGALSRPAIFLIEADGTISWRELTDDYRVRARAGDLLEALHAAE